MASVIARLERLTRFGLAAMLFGFGVKIKILHIQTQGLSVQWLSEASIREVRREAPRGERGAPTLDCTLVNIQLFFFQPLGKAEYAPLAKVILRKIKRYNSLVSCLGILREQGENGVELLRSNLFVLQAQLPGVCPPFGVLYFLLQTEVVMAVLQEGDELVSALPRCSEAAALSL